MKQLLICDGVQAGFGPRARAGARGGVSGVGVISSSVATCETTRPRSSQRYGPASSFTPHHQACRAGQGGRRSPTLALGVGRVGDGFNCWLTSPAAALPDLQLTYRALSRELGLTVAEAKT